MLSFRINKIALAIVLAFPGLFPVCATAQQVTMTPFGRLPDGQLAQLYTLENKHAAKVAITNYGGIVVSISVPDREGRMDDVVLGHDKVEDYIALSSNFGAIIGRYANRIARGQFDLDGKTYKLPLNNVAGGISCTIHGGKKGFHQVLWQAVPILENEAAGLRLHYVSADGEEGFPGKLDVTVTYWFTDANELRIEYQATTTKPTPINLTNHTYFNLHGGATRDILGHILELNAARYAPVTTGMIPTGTFAPVAGTPFDFITPRALGERIGVDDVQLKLASGYDHCFVINRSAGHAGKPDRAKAAEVYEPDSGRVLEVFTQEPGIQLYTGNVLDGSRVGKNKVRYTKQSGFCLETQHFADSPNQPGFPNTILRPGESYESATVYRFTTRSNSSQEPLRFSNARQAARLTGSTPESESLPNSNNTSVDYNIGGTDLGIVWSMNNGEYGVFFGDTYGRNHFKGGKYKESDWRCNVLLFSKDNHPEDGFVFSGMAPDSSGTAAREVIFGAKDKSGKGDWTSIPTGAICAGGKEYVHYMNIKKWHGWISNYSGLYRSADSGRNWTKCEDVTFGADSNFGQVGYYKKDGYVYMIGTETGRQSNPRLARFKEGDIESPSAYEYWNGGENTWIKGDENRATDLFKDTTGELSFLYHNKSKKWLLVYFCSKRYEISIRYASELTGPWSEPQTLAAGAQYPQLYGSYLHPVSADRDELYFLMSLWKPYNVFLMESKITCGNP